MKYQLVLQFRGEALQEFRDLDTLEETLQEGLADSGSFDGLDHGAHGANFFFYADRPTEALEKILVLLGQKEKLPGFMAAYRTVAEEGFHLLWPEKSPVTFKLR